MPSRKLNYRVYNPDLNCNCGHHHHSRDSAIRCADELGWTKDIVLERFSQYEPYKKKSIHHRRNKKWDITAGKIWYPDLYAW